MDQTRHTVKSCEEIDLGEFDQSFLSETKCQKTRNKPKSSPQIEVVAMGDLYMNVYMNLYTYISIYVIM